MNRISAVLSTDADTEVAATLSQVKASAGKVPNFLATLANAPAALDGYLSLSKALARGRHLEAREGNNDDTLERSLTRFARNIIRQRGLVSNEDLDIARRAEDRRWPHVGSGCQRCTQHVEQLCESVGRYGD